MRTLDRYIGRTALSGMVMVLLVMMCLDIVFRIMDEVGSIKNGYTFTEVLIFIGLTTPKQLYNYLPFSTLIGALVGLGSLASSSELVVMQAAGISVRRLVWAVIKPALVLVLAGQLLGEYVTPVCEQIAQSRQAMKQSNNGEVLSKKGLWNREGNQYMHFNVVEPNGLLYGVSVYEFDNTHQLQKAWFAKRAIYQGGYWQMEDIRESVFLGDHIERREEPGRAWTIAVTPHLLNLLVLDPDDLSMRGLWSYARYLGRQGQDDSEYWLAFWEKAVQPLASLALVIVAISAIFGPMRQVSMGSRVFTGVIIGIVFRTAQNLLGPASMVFGFPPLVAVCIPIAICLIVGFTLLSRVR